MFRFLTLSDIMLLLVFDAWICALFLLGRGVEGDDSVSAGQISVVSFFVDLCLSCRCHSHLFFFSVAGLHTPHVRAKQASIKALFA